MEKMINNLACCCMCCGLTAAMASCSEDSYAPDPDRNWAATTECFTPTDDAGFNTYYKPAIGRLGDPMPFYDLKAGDFKVLYLQEYDNNGACYHPFWGVSTKDGATTSHSVKSSPPVPAQHSRMLPSVQAALSIMKKTASTTSITPATTFCCPTVRW